MKEHSCPLKAALKAELDCELATMLAEGYEPTVSELVAVKVAEKARKLADHVERRGAAGPESMRLAEDCAKLVAYATCKNGNLCKRH